MTHCGLVNNVQIPALPWVTSISIWNLYMSTSIILEGINNWKQFILWSKEILYILWKTTTAFTKRQKLIKSWYYKFEPMPIFGKSQNKLELSWAKLSPNLSQTLNWNCTLTSWSLKLKLEVRVWGWNLKLKFEVEIWIWSLRLKFRVWV